MAQLKNIDTIQLSNMNLDTVIASVSNFRYSSFSSKSNSKDIVTAMRLLDQPSTYFFKLFFYFSNPYAEDELSSNLLGLEYNDRVTTEQNGWGANTALNYLYNNKEYTRFRYLSEFIKILSDINIYTPWYFQTVSGLDTALERSELSGKEFKLEEERKKITIKCLPDALDNRIGKMLDLYRAAAFSQILHKEIIPANLRKFDMGIFIFQPFIRNLDIVNPLRDWSTLEKDEKGKEYLKAHQDMLPYTDENNSIAHKSFMFNELYDDENEGRRDAMSYINAKFVELRNCEFDINSSKSVFGELNNIEGTNHEYEIGISFDTCYERRYDMTFNDVIGDYVIEDLFKTDKYGATRTDYDSLYDGENEILEMSMWSWDDRGKPALISEDTQGRKYEETNSDTNVNEPTKYDKFKDAVSSKVNGVLKDVGIDVAKMSEKYKKGDYRLIGKGTVDKYVYNNIYYGERVVENKSGNGILNNMVDNALGSAEQRLTGQLKSLLMGNLYKFSPTNDIASGIKNIDNGAIIGNTVDKVTNEIKNKVVENRANFTTDPVKLRKGKSIYVDDTPVNPGQHPVDSIGNRNTTTFKQEPIDSNINKNLSAFGNRYEQNGWTRKPKGNLNAPNNTANN